MAKVEPCTTARSMRLNILSKIHLRVSTAPTGTWPPESAFAKQHHVGLDAPVLDREEAAGAAEAGLDLVGDEQRAVLAAELGAPREVVVGRHVHALALDRLDDEGRDLARRERALERGEIVERDLDAVRQEAARSRRGRSSSPLSDSAP